MRKNEQQVILRDYGSRFASRVKMQQLLACLGGYKHKSSPKPIKQLPFLTLGSVKPVISR